MSTKPNFTLRQVIEQLDSGYYWDTDSLTFGCATGVPAGGCPSSERWGLSSFSEEQKQATLVAMSLWDELIPIDLSLGSSSSADILLINYTLSGQAYSYLPTDGDIFISI